MGAVDSANMVIANLEAKKEQAETALVSARQGWDTLSVEAQSKLVALDTAWKGKFTLAQSTIAEKDKIILSLTGQLDLQVKITDEYKAMYEGERALRINCDLGLALKDSRINQLERKNKLKNILGIAGWGAAAIVSIVK